MNSDGGTPWMGPLTALGQHEVWRSIWTYCTSILGDEGGPPGAPPAYRASGTFVRVDGKPYLLTAAHVWTRICGKRPGANDVRPDEGVGLVLEEDQAPIWLPRQVLSERVVSRRVSDEWGPDVALVGLPPSDAKRLEREKAFYDVDKARPLQSHDGARGDWVISGASAELSAFEPQEVRLKNHLLGNETPRLVEHAGLVYVELSYGQTNPDEIPHSWEGLSGAGLWLCHLVPGATRADLRVTPLLMGLAFYQLRSGPKRGVIRCHGPGSLEALGFSLLRRK